ncbi:MAG: membrane protein insertion efficiency factor YidD [Clostridia bacterium]
MRSISELLIGFYKRFISSSTIHRCIYTPTCSMYTLTSIKKHGAIKGCLMGARRILRCTPFHKGGYDPVPENYKGNAKWLI